MKTLTVLSIVLFSAAFSQAQQPVTVIEYAPGSTAMTSSQAIQTNTADIKAALDQLLNKAQQQLTDLDKQLQRTGDYLAANRQSVTGASNAIQQNGTTPTKTTSQLVSERSATAGSDVYNDSADGVFKGIGKTYVSAVEKDADGNPVTKQRDAANYTSEAKKLYDIGEFYRTRDSALTKQQALEAARLQAHLDLLQTQDSVETQRLTAQISTIDAELIAVRQDVTNASDELAIHEKAITLQEAADAKAKMETYGQGAGSMTQKASDTAAKVQQMVQNMKDQAKQNADSKTTRGRLP
ncbi:MAG: hypothetical protein JWO94_3550 [Verrucomicrobiaceae bacterium]|nr:hypothetical protein [Verrucomicrobiaceae bacterium]